MSGQRRTLTITPPTRVLQPDALEVDAVLTDVVRRFRRAKAELAIGRDPYRGWEAVFDEDRHRGSRRWRP